MIWGNTVKLIIVVLGFLLPVAVAIADKAKSLPTIEQYLRESVTTRNAVEEGTV
jgi:hypothetical protein